MASLICIKLNSIKESLYVSNDFILHTLLIQTVLIAADFAKAAVTTFDLYCIGWLCWGLTSQSTIFQSYRDGAIASWVINQYFRGVKCLAQGHNTAVVGLEPRTSRYYCIVLINNQMYVLRERKTQLGYTKILCFHDNLSHVLNGDNTHSQSYLSLWST